MPTHKEVREPKFNPQSIDAKEWVNEFNRIEVSNGLQPTDPGKMLGWFANAIMAGYDEARRKYEKSQEVKRLGVKEILKLLEDYKPTEFKTIGIIGGYYASEAWHIKDHMKRLAQKIREDYQIIKAQEAI